MPHHHHFHQDLGQKFVKSFRQEFQVTFRNPQIVYCVPASTPQAVSFAAHVTTTNTSRLRGHVRYLKGLLEQQLLQLDGLSYWLSEMARVRKAIIT